MQNIGEPIKTRRLEFDLRPIALEELASSLQLAQKAVDQYRTGDERYAHIAETDMNKVSTSIDTTSKWLQEKRTVLATCPRQNNPPVTVADIRQEKTVSICKERKSKNSVHLYLISGTHFPFKIFSFIVSL